MRASKEDIKEYWDKRAKQHPDSPQATTDDIYLRELEIITIADKLKEIRISRSGSVLDIGCGDGYSTLRIAEKIKHLFFTGIDYSKYMIENARNRLKLYPGLKDRVFFVLGDVLKLDSQFRNSLYDVILTDRCLINLNSFSSQSEAIAQIASHLKPGGYYIALENFIEGQENMNKARKSVGVPEIPVREHNLYFKEKDFVGVARRFFDKITFNDFSSSYYFATRVIYSALCKEQKIDYRHEIHRLAVNLPWFGQFSPIRMIVSRKKR